MQLTSQGDLRFLAGAGADAIATGISTQLMRGDMTCVRCSCIGDRGGARVLAGFLSERDGTASLRSRPHPDYRPHRQQQCQMPYSGSAASTGRPPSAGRRDTRALGLIEVGVMGGTGSSAAPAA